MAREGDRSCSRASYQAQLRRAVGRLLPRHGLQLLGDDKRLRRTDRMLAICAILVAWASAPSLADWFAEARAGVAPARRDVPGLRQGAGAAALRALVALVCGARCAGRWRSRPGPRGGSGGGSSAGRLHQARLPADAGNEWNLQAGGARSTTASATSGRPASRAGARGGCRPTRGAAAAPPSPAAALRRVRAAMNGRAPLRLDDGVRDRYSRRGEKRSRRWPHKKRCHPPGVPVARTASPAEVELAQLIKQQNLAA